MGFFKKMKEWLKPDDDVIESFLGIIVLLIMGILFYFLILPNISGTSNLQEECIPDYQTGNCFY